MMMTDYVSTFYSTIEIAPSETCLSPAQPPQGFPNDFPVFLTLGVTLINIEK